MGYIKYIVIVIQCLQFAIIANMCLYVNTFTHFCIMSNKVSPFKITIPPLLNTINSPPKQLFYKGVDFDALTLMPRVAIVGARKATSYGNYVANLIAGDLARQGIVIVSGLAFGIDAVAHQATLQAGGRTISILPSSLEKVYPSSHNQLAQKIVKQGGLISEYAQGQSVRKHHFIQRNRLISGLSDVIIVVEASESSGSLHTAKFAKEQGKILCAVPGNINSAQSAGCNQLIKDGATPITSAKDILRIFNIAEASQQTKLMLSSEEEIIVALIQKGATSTADVVARSKLPANICNNIFTMLEIQGVIIKTSTGNWQIN